MIHCKFSEQLFFIEFIHIRVTDVTTTYLIIVNKDCQKECRGLYIKDSALIRKTQIAGSCLFKILKLKSKHKKTEKLHLLEVVMTDITICYQFSIDYLCQTIVIK